MFQHRDIPHDTTKYFQAAKRNDLTRLKYLIVTDEVPLTITDPEKQTLAHIAARNDFFDMLVYIVKKEPSVLRAVDADGYSVLHLAIEEGHTKMVKYLVDNYNLNLHKQSQRGWGTAIHLAVEFDRLDILKYFIDEKKGDVNIRGKLQNLPPVFLAVRYQYRDIIDYLVKEKGADLTLIDRDRENILYPMLRKNDLPSMKHLLDKNEMNFDVNQQNYLGETLAHVAVMLNRVNILKYLVDEKRAEINLATKRDGMTPLHCAAAKNRFEICQYLIEKGADAQLKDESGQLATQKASDVRLIEYLEKFAPLPVSTLALTNTSEPTPESMPAPDAPAPARSRRNVQLHLSSPPLLWSIGSSRERDGINCLGEARLHNYSAQLHSFLVMAQLIIATHVSHPSKRQVAVTSPGITLQKKMDPLAVDTVLNVPDFLK